MPAPFPSSLTVSALMTRLLHSRSPLKDVRVHTPHPHPRSHIEAGNGTSSVLSVDLSLAVLIWGLHLGLTSKCLLGSPGRGVLTVPSVIHSFQMRGLPPVCPRGPWPAACSPLESFFPSGRWCHRLSARISVAPGLVVSL